MPRSVAEIMADVERFVVSGLDDAVLRQGDWMRIAREVPSSRIRADEKAPYILLMHSSGRPVKLWTWGIEK